MHVQQRNLLQNSVSNKKQGLSVIQNRTDPLNNQRYTRNYDQEIRQKKAEVPRTDVKQVTQEAPISS